MKIILCESVPNLGEMGATVTVADGYGRNYLIPNKLAVRVDSASAKQIDHELQIIRRREEAQRAALAQKAATIEGITVEIKARAGEEDKLFGSVTTSQIAEKLAEMGHEVDRKALALDEPIRSLGVFPVTVRLAGGIEANVSVWVSAEEEEPEA